ncbi:MAG: hypothetical protein J3K34DRAFT_20235 [Monoraphidium minutum]|nr:MAG: hypothetical protein J3K34DRAFT_20235 [Monoraphidium minutum]
MRGQPLYISGWDAVSPLLLAGPGAPGGFRNAGPARRFAGPWRGTRRRHRFKPTALARRARVRRSAPLPQAFRAPAPMRRSPGGAAPLGWVWLLAAAPIPPPTHPRHTRVCRLLACRRGNRAAAHILAKQSMGWGGRARIDGGVHCPSMPPSVPPGPRQL